MRRGYDRDVASVLQEGRDPGQLSAVRERARRLVPEADADAVEDFVGQFYRWVPEEDMRAHRVPELAGAALSLWRLARERDTTSPAPPVVRAQLNDLSGALGAVVAALHRVYLGLGLGQQDLVRVPRPRDLGFAVSDGPARSIGTDSGGGR